MKKMKSFYRAHKSIRILSWVLRILLILFVIVEIFTHLYPEFGARVHASDREDYQKRADDTYYNGRKFFYPSAWKIEGVSADVRVSEKGTTPKEALPTQTPQFLAAGDDSDVTVTWFGHSTLLIQMHGKNILVDPVLSEYAFMFQFLGPKRFSEPVLTIEELPDIDVVLISHDHYDHLDMASIRKLAGKTDHFLVPLGIEKHLLRWGVDPAKIENKAWWEETVMDGLTITCTPSYHTCNRSFDDNKEKLWSSWVLEDEHHRIYYGGDSGYGGHFKEIHERFGDFDLVMLDDAQYDKMWHTWHMYPEETVMAAKELGAAQALPIHWGAFVLSSHAWDDPVERYEIAATREGFSMLSPVLGETVYLSRAQEYKTRWWRNM